MENQLQTTRSLDRISFTDDQMQLIRSQIAPKANPNELALFMHQCKRTGLDPLSRQIYCIHLGGKMTIQTSIDGFRVIAERSGDYAGQDAPEFLENESGLIACRITVYRFRGEQRYPAAVGVAYMREYNAGGPMWGKMPHTMLAKCAEAQALRKAYPQDLSGLYTGDEMEQADPLPMDIPHEDVTPPKKRLSDAGFAKLMDRVNGGDTAAADKAIETFILTDEQKETLSAAYLEKA